MVRRRLWSSFGFAGFAFATPMLAQTGAEPAPHPCDSQTGATKAVCRAGYDAVTTIVPVGALVASGGNPHLGTAGGGRGFGDLGFTFRGTIVRTILPSTAYNGTTDTVPAARRLPVVAPSLDLRMGLLNKALPVGTASVDFLATILGVPERATDYVRFSADARRLAGLALGFGYGLRIGMQPKGPLPVASLNVGRHDFPKFTVGDLTAGSQYAYTVAISAINVRLMVGKRFGGFEFTAGGGADLMKGNYSIVFRDQDSLTVAPRADSTVSTMRIVTVTNASFLLGRVARLTFEGGFQIGKDEKLPTVFAATNTKSGRFFGSMGLGFKL